MSYPRLIVYFCLFPLSFSVCPPAHSQDERANYSPATSGFLGLNTVPSARLNKAGTIRGGVSALDPFVHGFIGAQITTPLYVQFRQTSETSGIFNDADKLLPGVDLKLRLVKEGPRHPAIAIGVQSALGHRRMSGEYLAMSKRYNNWDFTAGIGWGRYGTAKHFNNPLGIFGTHFDQNRDLIGEDPNTPSDWFTGEHIGLFGGVEYFLPYDGLSLKFDYGSDRYASETRLSDYEAPSPWGIGLAYNYKGWAHAALGMQGTDKVMGRISFSASPAKWPFQNYLPPDKGERYIKNTAVASGRLKGSITLPNHANAPDFIGLAARHALTEDNQDFNEIALTLKSQNLTGPTIHLSKSDIEHAAYHHDRSPNEIWQNTSLSTNADALTLLPEKSAPAINFLIGIENELSLSEEDSGTLYRTSAVVGAESTSTLGFMGAAHLRINLLDNLDNLHELRPQALLPVHSDIDRFADNTVNADRLFGAYTQSFTPELHAGLSAGYLEEFYAGFGGELLYRPINSRFALGAELWQAFRRDPETSLSVGLNGQQVTTGHANIWYDIPRHDVTAKLSAGRFLAGDTGLSFSLEKEFLNGALLTGQISLSNASDPDIFGNTTHAYHSIGLTLPLGSIPYITEGSYIKTKLSPLGRDIAQRINKPIDLFEMTNPFTSDHIAKHWQKITTKTKQP